MEQIKRLFLSFALILTSSLIYAQTEVTGTVLDELGEGAIGATVVEKGTSNGAMTDIDGNFKLKVQPGATLVISDDGGGCRKWNEGDPAGRLQDAAGSGGHRIYYSAQG